MDLISLNNQTFLKNWFLHYEHFGFASGMWLRKDYGLLHRFCLLHFFQWMGKCSFAKEPFVELPHVINYILHNYLSAHTKYCRLYINAFAF